MTTPKTPNSAVYEADPVSTQYNALVSLTGNTKLTTLTEVGVMPDPALIAAYGLRWRWWCTWSGDYVSGGSYNSLNFLKSAFTSLQGLCNQTSIYPPSAISLDDLPTRKAMERPPPPTTTEATSTTKATTYGILIKYLVVHKPDLPNCFM
ncbi:hypothetical protein BGX38DRAFT_724711 [Terfezia claveryi]|nr:hypothetical protein BGX38DRAFT_724711 [Terfezia claveryi]